ncbi:unnamed protein product [Larinioides sclopetarius]|uniref:Uncharacterized protein n=1 Tax=Larinioides sclopetarius TaxID=280406 RepID=A0AAV2BNF2_9ARAC
MTMKDMHGLECPQCKIRDEFYERFNSDSKKNVSYFGVISYVNNYYVMPVSSDKSKEEFPKNGRNCKGSNICFLQLINEWTVRDLIAKRIKQKNGLLTKHLTEKNELFSERFKQKKRKSGPKPSFYLPEHTGNLITIKKSESFTESSPDDTVCSDNLETTKVVYKCKLTKKSPSKEKVAPKEPKIGTLKRKRWNWEKLKQKELYEDDLFEEKKFKRIPIEDSNNSEEDKITTPRWSVQISPRDLSRSPSYEDCYSPTELQTSRKEAEEYQYRRNKRKKCMAICKKDDPEAVMKKDIVTYETLTAACGKIEKLREEREKVYDSDQDDYYSEGSSN